MDLLQKTKDLLSLHSVKLKKRLGQNLVVDMSFLKKMTHYASLTEEDVVLEVGAGLGFLTKLLSEKCKKVLAVEIDPKLMEILKKQLGDSRNVELIKGDILKVHLPSFNKIVSTPPYYIASSLLFFLLEKGFDCAILSLQKEFAERLVATVGSKDYSRLTVMVYYRAEAELLDHVPKDVFFPPPEVDSTMVRLKPHKPPFPLENEKTFFELVRIMFSQRNRNVKNGVSLFLREGKMNQDYAREITNSLFFKEKRVRELTPEDFGAIANELFRKELYLQ